MTKLTHRYLARVLVEAKTPLKIGTGDKGVTIDEMVATDANGLPMIPGTAIAGVLRHSFEEESEQWKLFGFQKGKEAEGSRFIFSEARFVGKEGKVVDGLQTIDFNSDAFYSQFKKLAVRDHARITHRGVADSENHGKFDSQVVYKGCQFVFDIEFLGNADDSDSWNALLAKLNSPLFRLGGGTRKGFGELEIKAIDENDFDLKKDLTKYLDRSTQLTVPQGRPHGAAPTEDTIEYKLVLAPDDFFIFSSGYGDNEVDAVAKTEKVVEWNNSKPYFSNEKILIPATSVKGAISHRTAFHYNRLTQKFADEVEKIEDFVGENNEAVAALFGFAKDSKKGDDHGARGKVLISDVFVDTHSEKIFNHVAIDRFTGGAMDGALFDEKVTHTEEEIILNIIVEDSAFSDKDTQKAFEAALKDITTGMLPLGGSVNRGHGVFSGELTRDGEVI